MLAQVPAILEALTGVRMSDLMAQVPGLRTVESTTGDGSSDGAQPANGAKEPPQVPVVQRVKVPAPEANETTATDNATDAPATPSNNSTAGPSTGATNGPRKQPMR
jgi:hypothetical protein